MKANARLKTRTQRHNFGLIAKSYVILVAVFAGFLLFLALLVIVERFLIGLA